MLDNAKYHNETVEKIPTKSSTKQATIQYLAAHDMAYKKKMLKAELFLLIKASNPTKLYLSRLTDILATKHSYDVLRLPVGHCEPNPIELIWAQVKG